MHLLINFILALILDSAGFVMYVYFFSIGYGLSVAGLAAAMLFMFRGSLLPAHVIMCLLLIVYGFCSWDRPLRSSSGWKQVRDLTRSQ